MIIEVLSVQPTSVKPFANDQPAGRLVEEVWAFRRREFADGKAETITGQSQAQRLALRSGGCIL
jgi:hypothetical protein